MVTLLTLVILSVLGVLLAYKHRTSKAYTKVNTSPWMFGSVLSMAAAIMQGVDTLIIPTFQRLSALMSTLGANPSQIIISLFLLFSVICWVYCMKIPTLVATYKLQS